MKPVRRTITDQNASPNTNTSGRDRVSASLASGRPASTYMIVNAGPETVYSASYTEKMCIR